MEAAVSPKPSDEVVAEPSPRQFTVDEYYQMAEAGILNEDDRVELIGGEIIQMAPIGGPHVTCVGKLTRLLVLHLEDRAVVNIQCPVRIALHDEPQPDVAVLQAREYGPNLPRPADVLLLMEVSDTTLAYDRRVKLPLYANAGIQEYWVVDLQGEAIERHTEPSGGLYRVTVRASRGEEIESAAIPGLVLKVDAVLGPAPDTEVF